MDDGFKVEFLGGDDWKALLQVESHLVPEHAYCTSARTVVLLCAMVQHMLHQI